MCRWLRRISVCAVALVWLALGLAVNGQEPAALDAYLQHLGLQDLRLHYLERRLAGENDAVRRAALAQSIVEGYTDELVAAADDPARYAALKVRVERFLDQSALARTAALDVLLLQADYQRAEALILQWQEDPAETAPLAAAREILDRVQPALAGQQAALTAAMDKAAETLDGIASEAARLTAEKGLTKQRALAARADYFAGWSAYYLGVARRDAAAASADFTEAKQHFLRILDVSDERDYGLVEAKELGLDSMWRARSVIGLGLAELGLKHLSAGERVFGWLSDGAVAPAIRDQADYWHFQGLVNAQLWDAAGRFAAARVEHFSPAASAGKTTLCTTAIVAGAALAEGDEQVRMVKSGVRGLARMRQFDALDKLVVQHGLDDLLPDDFCLLWLKGRREYLAAEKAKDEAGFGAAAQTLARALKSPEARLELVDASQARYYLGWARYRLDEFDAAAQLFREAAAALRSAAPDVAVQAAWMHCTCLVKATERDSRQAAAAVTALATFKQDYPHSQEAQQVDLLVARLRQSHLPPEQSIRELARIAASDPSYLAAQVEICQLQHQLFTGAKSDAAKAQRLGKDVLASGERVLAAAGAAPELRLKAALVCVDVLSRGETADWPRIEGILRRVANDAGKLDEAAAARVEYEYRRLEAAQHRGDARGAQQAADWIAVHGRGTAYELPALILVAREADRAASSAAAEQRGEKRAQARDVYDRLVRLLGESPEALKANKNSLAAASKLAQYDEELAHWPQAAERLWRLVEVLPSDRRLLRRAGLAMFRAGKHDQALACFRTLVAGLPGGSDEWLEAKYYQLACLEKTDPAAAKKVLGQFQVLYPEVKSEAWRERFSQLAARLGSSE